MPFYEYQCTACAHRLEALQKIVDAPLLYCPECGEASLKKLISKSAFRLKGAGWYATDFKNSGAQEDRARKKDGGKDGGNDGDKDGAGKGADSKPKSSPPSETTSASATTSGDKKDGASKKSSSAEPMQKSA